MNIVSRPTASLRPHELLAAVPALPDDSPEFLRLVESVRTHGLIDPLKITQAGLIVDGRHRARALKEIDPEGSAWCLVVPDDRAAELALETLCARRHLVTKGQLAYVAFPLFAPAYEALRARCDERLRTGMRKPGSGESVETLAAQIGVSRDEFFRAAKLHAIFAENPELRDEWEPKILCSENPVGLGAVVSGIAGAAATRGTERAPTRNTALARWDVSWGELANHSKSWDRWSEEAREHAAERVRETIAVLPSALLNVLTDALRAARRARKETLPEEELPETPALSDEARTRIAAAAAKRWAKYPPGTHESVGNPATA